MRFLFVFLLGLIFTALPIPLKDGFLENSIKLYLPPFPAENRPSEYQVGACLLNYYVLNETD